MSLNRTVFSAPDVYAGWPANHGAWQWGDELLVGFLCGPHAPIGHRTHNIERPYRKLLARSLDGGDSWSTEEPNVEFSAAAVHPAPAFDLDEHIIRVCGVYDTGGEDCDPRGGFYISADRGKSWQGAFAFAGLEADFNGMTSHCTSRTRVVDGLVYLSVASRHTWGSDSTFAAEHDGERFRLKSVVLADDCRAVMPAVAKVGDRIVVALRRRGTRYPGGWVDAVWSDDGGESWSEPVLVGLTGGRNGNPPALAEVDGHLYCAYANRNRGEIMIAASTDRGQTWWPEVLRTSGQSDIGYPQLFRRADGQLVCVYYWADKGSEAPQRIEATVFDPIWIGRK